ncbi:MAG: response regulator [Elusimicrobia bacterium]|nr:response regulator [Elusimicrobiota bacterium]
MTRPARDKALILLVEDDPDDVELTLRAFKKTESPNPVRVARDGAEAIAFLFAEGAEPPGLILLDIHLPKVDGLEVLRRIRSDDRTRFIPVVALTSSREEKDLIKSYRLGVNSYIRKPVNFADFAAAMRHLSLYWLSLNEPPPEA